MSIGTMVIDEVLVPITNVILRDGLIWFRAESASATAAVREGAEISIFGDDGSLVFHAPGSSRATRVTPDGGRLAVTFPVRINNDVQRLNEQRSLPEKRRP